MRGSWKSNKPASIPVFIAGLTLLMLCGCGEKENAASKLSDKSVAGSAQRVVCGSPAVAEIVFALGCGNRVVGVSDYTIYPPEAKDKESIGGWINPNRERILVLKPDVIITQGQHETLATFADEYGFRFQAVKLDTLADVYTAIESIANVLGVEQRGEALNSDIRQAIGAVSASAATGSPECVLLLFGRTPGCMTGLGTVGPGTFLDDMIRVAGGTNIFADAKGSYPQISKESLVVRRPEVILEVNPGGLEEKAIALLRADWQEFADLPAVRNGRIHYLTNDFLLIPGPRVGLIAEEFAKAINGEGKKSPAD